MASLWRTGFENGIPTKNNPRSSRAFSPPTVPNPDCLKGVKLTRTVEEAPPDRPVVARSYAAATNWVLNEKRGLYPDLESFLQSNDPAASAYRHYKFRP